MTPAKAAGKRLSASELLSEEFMLPGYIDPTQVARERQEENNIEKY